MRAASTGLTAFPRVCQEGDHLVVVDGPWPENFRAGLKQVLTYYDIPWTEEGDGVILEPASISLDRDLCWNYSIKAVDVLWLRSHVGRYGDV